MNFNLSGMTPVENSGTQKDCVYKGENQGLSMRWLILFLLLMTACGAPGGQVVPVIVDSGTEQVLIQARLADSPKEHAQGLMHKSYLPQDGGMIFLFDGLKVRHFWMKETLIPLDMVFINDKREIVYIEYEAQPSPREPHQIYSSQVPAKYVLEVNAGVARFHGWKVGDKVILPGKL